MNKLQIINGFRWLSATRKYLFVYPQGDRSALRKPKKHKMILLHKNKLAKT